MKLNAYGRRLEVLKENNIWVIYVLGEGKKTKANDIVIPSELSPKEVIIFLEDIFHEAATPKNPAIVIVD